MPEAGSLKKKTRFHCALLVFTNDIAVSAEIAVITQRADQMSKDKDFHPKNLSINDSSRFLSTGFGR